MCSRDLLPRIALAAWLMITLGCEPTRVTPFDLADDAGIFTLTLVFDAFDDVPNGTRVVVTANPERSQARFVQEGGFILRDLQPTASEVLVHVAFDLNGNGSCDPAEAFSASLSLSAGIEVLRLRPTDLSPDSCL